MSTPIQNDTLTTIAPASLDQVAGGKGMTRGEIRSEVCGALGGSIAAGEDLALARLRQAASSKGGYRSVRENQAVNAINDGDKHLSEFKALCLK